MSKWRLWGSFGASGGPKSRPKGVRTAKSGLGQGRRRGQDSHFEVFWATSLQKSLFLEMYEKHEENNGFWRVGEGPSAQVGGTWATKSCPRGIRTAKMTSKSAARGVRAVKVGPVRSTWLQSLWNGPQTKPDMERIWRQSLSKQQDIWLDLLSLSLSIYIYIRPPIWG